uniref:Uncharacterized protein n=1 Tax=Panagrolaimus davidi TaxID=227884 RepID=A0A914PHQ3_9BILA
MAYISRTARIVRYFKYAPRHLFNKYPEQFVAYCTFGVAGLVACVYKLWNYDTEAGNIVYSCVILNYILTNYAFAGASALLTETLTQGLTKALTKSYKKLSSKPWYRSRYEVVRPNDPRALGWRAPEEYPPPYLTNRDNVGFTTVKADYGFKASL